MCLHFVFAAYELGATAALLSSRIPMHETLYTGTALPSFKSVLKTCLFKSCVCLCVHAYDPVHLCHFWLFVCEACKAQCAHPAWVRYHAIKIHLLLLLLLLLYYSNYNRSSSARRIVFSVAGQRRRENTYSFTLNCKQSATGSRLSKKAGFCQKMSCSFKTSSSTT